MNDFLRDQIELLEDDADDAEQIILLLKAKLRDLKNIHEEFDQLSDKYDSFSDQTLDSLEQLIANIKEDIADQARDLDLYQDQIIILKEFEKFSSELPYRNLLEKLNDDSIRTIISKIESIFSDDNDLNSRESKINRLFIDLPEKPKHHLIILELLANFNSRYAREIEKISLERFR